MKKEKEVSLFIEDNILIRITNNKEEADYVITSEKKSTVKSMVVVDTGIIDYIRKYEISDKSHGFYYFIMAIRIASEKIHNNKMYTLARDIYPPIAECYSVTENSVARAMCNAIDRSNAKGISAKSFINGYELNCNND